MDGGRTQNWLLRVNLGAAGILATAGVFALRQAAIEDAGFGLGPFAGRGAGAPFESAAVGHGTFDDRAFARPDATVHDQCQARHEHKGGLSFQRYHSCSEHRWSAGSVIPYLD